MQTDRILATIDSRIAALTAAKQLLSSEPVKKKRVLSAKARKAIALGQKRRWAKKNAA